MIWTGLKTVLSSMPGEGKKINLRFKRKLNIDFWGGSMERLQNCFSFRNKYSNRDVLNEKVFWIYLKMCHLFGFFTQDQWNKNDLSPGLFARKEAVICFLHVPILYFDFIAWHLNT